MREMSTLDEASPRRRSAAGRAAAVQDHDLAAIFPLRLTTFEKYMLWDDRPDYPMSFVVQLKLLGRLEREAFVAAVDAAVLRHPLLRALVRAGRRGGPVWELAADPRPPIRWGTLGEPIGEPLGTWIDLVREPGLRVWVHEGDEGGRDTVEFTFQFHHACCDGSGSLRFIGDVLAAYGQRTASADRRPVMRPCDPAHLTARGVLPPPAAARRRAGGLLASLSESFFWLVRRPVSLRRRGGPRSGEAGRFFDSAAWHTFDHAEARAVRRAAMRRGVTMNDLLLREMFRSLAQWSFESGREFVRIALPVSTSVGGKLGRTAANGVSYSFLTRRGRDCVDPHALMAGLLRENDGPTRRRRARAFLRILQVVERIPGAVPYFMGADRCFATAVFSNLGDIARHFDAEFPLDEGRIVAGTLVLDEILGFPPIRPRTRAAFMVGQYAGRCRVCVRCDPGEFSPEDAGGLLAGYVAGLQAAMENG
jgi:hypothetical protein